MQCNAMSIILYNPKDLQDLFVMKKVMIWDGTVQEKGTENLQ